MDKGLIIWPVSIKHYCFCISLYLHRKILIQSSVTCHHVKMLFSRQEMNYKYWTKCQPIEVILVYHKVKVLIPQNWIEFSQYGLNMWQTRQEVHVLVLGIYWVKSIVFNMHVSLWGWYCVLLCKAKTLYAAASTFPQ